MQIFCFQMLAPDNVQNVCMEHIYDRDPAVACMGKVHVLSTEILLHAANSAQPGAPLV